MKRLQTLVIVAAGLSAARAEADCTPRSHLSTCIDIDTFWPHAGPSTFAFIGSTDVTAPGRVGLGMVTTYLRRPIVFRVPSADPAGNEIAAVDHVVDSTFLWSYGIAERAELTAALSTTSYQTGTGVSALAEQDAKALPHTALRDARLGASYALLPSRTDRASARFGVAARFQISLPTGDEQSFAGDRSAVGIPGFAFDLRKGRWLGAAEVGARLRQTSDLLGARVGSQVFFGLGTGVHVIAPEILSVLIEAVALPTLADQRREAYDAARRRHVEWSTGRALVPAEWALSVRTVPVREGDFSVGLAGGGRLPITGDPGITTPAYRFSLVLRYAPVAR
jgi:OmpA-OmpF porin, OOP family